MIQEKVFRPVTGWFPLIVCLGLFVGGPALIIYTASSFDPPPVWPFILAVLMIATAIVTLFGFQAVAPKQRAGVLTVWRIQRIDCRIGVFLGEPIFFQEADLVSCAELRDRFGDNSRDQGRYRKDLAAQVAFVGSPIEGERPRRQPDRYLGNRRLEGGQHGRSPI